MHQLSPRSRVRLGNSACAYCHKPFDQDVCSEEEHVIGKSFVPKGTVPARGNLIVNACRPCNEAKARLENDLSAIIMRPDPLQRFPSDSRLVAEAIRKQTARSVRTGKAVRESAEELTIQAQIMPGVTLSTNMIGGPQMDQHRVHRLAFFHVSAFFYWATFDADERRGRPIQSFTPIAGVARADWGNARMLGFQSLIGTWPHDVHAVGAEGYFKTVIRRAVEPVQPLWGWASEWNRAFRVIGFFGDADAVASAVQRLPVPRKVLVEKGIHPTKGPFETWMRADVPMADGDDHLFSPP